MTERFNGPYKITDAFDEFDLEHNDTIYLIRDENNIPKRAFHKCPCGCAGARDIPLNGNKNSIGAGWNLVCENPITITPSIRDLATCHAHYFITDGMVKWCD